MQTENRHSWKAPKRERVTVGRVIDPKTKSVIFEGVSVVGRLATPHPLHGHLKKIVVVKIPVEGGYYMQRMKLKTALQRGYYSINATTPKDKAAIEKALEPFQKVEAANASGDSHIDAMRDLQEVIRAKTPNA